MMTIFLGCFIAYCLITAKYKNIFLKDVVHNDNLSKESSDCINGIFVVLVFLSHFHFEIENFHKIDFVYDKFQWLCGQLIVCSFLFFSGFGIYESLKKDREGYTKKILCVKFPRLLLRFDICVLLYAIMQILLGNVISLKSFFLSLLTIDSLGNSNWYITYILMSYLITWLAFRFFKTDKDSIFFITIMMGVYSVLFYLINPNDSHYYVTSFIYPLGMVYSMYKDKIEEKIKKHWIMYFIIFFGLYIISWYLWAKYSLPMITYNLISIFMMISLILFTYKVSFRGKILSILGKNVFQIYIIQHLPGIVLKPIQKYLGGGYTVYFILCILSTWVLVIVMNWFFKKFKI